ncbi:MAG: AAA family ATPase [Chloroflexota bacterium]|nr:AAA family ATPase [Chloroflexota bacterium]
MSTASPLSSARRAPSVYEAVGLLDDPFPRDPRAGAYVALPQQATVLAGVRAWLALGNRDAVGLAVVAGAAGSGKTRLLEQLVIAIADDDRLIGVVPDEGARRTDASLLRSAIGSLGGTPGGRTGLELTSELREILDAHREDLLPPVLLIDNAALTGSQLEILRGVLTQPARGVGQTRVQIVLFGPPALPDRIARRRSLAELTRYVATMPPLDVDGARTLLDGRIEAVRDPYATLTEHTNPFFDEVALETLLEASGGMPDALLALAHAAVREAIATGRRQVDAVTAQTVTHVLPAQGEAPPQARAISSADPVIQTRLSLPGMNVGEEPAPASRRRGQQR